MRIRYERRFRAMIGSELRNLPKEILQSFSFRWTVLLLTIVLVGVAIYAAGGGKFEIAGQLASITVALATILLVSLTSQYAERTRELVEESKHTREQRERARMQENQRELDSLRRALKKEISTVAYLDDFAGNYDVGNSAIGIDTPSTIYDTNASKIGLLTPEEVDYVVEYYTRLDRVSKLIEHQRHQDTTLDMGPIEEGVKISEGLIEQSVHKLALGYLGSPSWEKRKGVIQDNLQSLSEAQDNAIDALEENLQN